ncbi:hypothetical protein BC940DRAFT_291237 [Gongronella butleri]|nr:hypothetical protein BC940DRAFT_291237 [Gongronella butleri]
MRAFFSSWLFRFLQDLLTSNANWFGFRSPFIVSWRQLPTRRCDQNPRSGALDARETRKKPSFFYSCLNNRADPMSMGK